MPIAIVVPKDVIASAQNPMIRRPCDRNALNYVIVVSGQIVGTWKRTFSKEAVIIEKNLFRPLTQPENRAVASEADQYGRFVGLPVELRHTGA